MILDDPILDDLDEELPDKNECRTFKHKNGYTNITICNCKYGGYGHGR
jgi:hypothetical protein|tara:strand:- start:4302 stop:4445 length:144 start_codon:yes stop_codon:yes gene_type:complete